MHTPTITALLSAFTDRQASVLAPGVVKGFISLGSFSWGCPQSTRLVFELRRNSAASGPTGRGPAPVGAWITSVGFPAIRLPLRKPLCAMRQQLEQRTLALARFRMTLAALDPLRKRRWKGSDRPIGAFHRLEDKAPSRARRAPHLHHRRGSA